MAFLGLVSKKEHNTLLVELEALKAKFQPFERWQLETAEGEKFNLPDPSVYDNQAKLFQYLSWVVQAVDITAAAGALTPFSVARVIAGKEPKDIPNHEFEMLLRKPNPLDSRYEFLYATIAMFMLNGNSYWWLNRKDEFSPPAEIWFIPPSMIIPVPDENLFLRGYMYYPGTGSEIFLPPHEIVHFKRFNPFSRFVGLSAIESIALVAQGDLGMQDWNTRLFKENNARLPGIIAFSNYPETVVWNDIKDNIREASKKRENMLLRGVGQGGVQWLQNAVSQREMEFLQGREFNRDEIWNTLAPGLVSMLSASATEANSRTGRAVFNELTLYPKHVLMGEKITSDILPAYGSDRARPLIGHFEDIRITDKELELREQERYEKTHTVNEIREEFYGDEPIEDERGELFVAQINAQSGGIQEPPMPAGGGAFGKPPAKAEPKAEDEKELQKAENKPPKEPEESESAAKMLEELGRFERKALRTIGRTTFASEILPADMVQGITAKLADCKDVKAVKAVFAVEKKAYKPQVMVGDASIALFMDGLRKAIEKA